VTSSEPSPDAARELPPVSVVVPVLNGERTVGACIESLLALDYPPDRVELIVVDNGSSDNTRAILERYAPRLRVLEETTRGPGAARNRGVAGASHPLIAFTDADCRVDRSWLRRLVAPLDDPAIGIAGGRILAIDPSNPIERFGETLHDHERAMTAGRFPYAITMCWASRTSVLREHSFDPAFLRGEDSELSYRLVFAGFRLAYVADAIVRHHNRSTERALFHEAFQSGFWAVAIFRKHREAMESAGARRVDAATYRPLFASLMGAAEGNDEDGYRFLYHLGRKLGLLSGSIRFGFIRL
jgi:glycosyltransferase involved in cell wall biosynthesis